MRFRKYPFLSRRVITFNVDDFGVDPPTTNTIVVPNVLDVHISLGDDPDLIYYRKPTCSQRGSHNIVNNGTFIRKLETGTLIKIQRYRCNDCHSSFETRPPSLGC
ncbi:hypothetical protein Thermo_00831 [Thermoplasmatales archaeon]|nr:hypothetical protein Thermo_00831 [Thermoplasmatales archaeon]